MGTQQAQLPSSNEQSTHCGAEDGLRPYREKLDNPRGSGPDACRHIVLHHEEHEEHEDIRDTFRALRVLRGKSSSSTRIQE
jgi:hypothetical protein